MYADSFELIFFFELSLLWTGEDEGGAQSRNVDQPPFKKNDFIMKAYIPTFVPYIPY